MLLKNVLGVGCYCEKTNASLERVLMQFSSRTENLVQGTFFNFINISVLCLKKKKNCFHEVKGISKAKFSFNDFLFFLCLGYSFLVQKALIFPVHFPLPPSPLRPQVQEPTVLLVGRQPSIISLCILFKVIGPRWNQEVYDFFLGGFREIKLQS